MKAFIEAGAAAVHFEDQLSSEKKCGHLGGRSSCQLAVRSHAVAGAPAATFLDVPTLLIATPMRLSAKLLTADTTKADRRLRHPGERTAEGFFRVNDGVLAAVARGLAMPPTRPAVVRDLDARHRGAETFARATPRRLPGSCSRTTLAVVQLGRHLTEAADRELSNAISRHSATASSSVTLARIPPRSTPRCSSSHGATANRSMSATSSSNSASSRSKDEATRHGHPARGRLRLLRQVLETITAGNTSDARTARINRGAAVRKRRIDGELITSGGAQVRSDRRGRIDMAERLLKEARHEYDDVLSPDADRVPDAGWPASSPASARSCLPPGTLARNACATRAAGFPAADPPPCARCDWSVVPAPADLRDPPRRDHRADRSQMVINALNSARGSSCPTSRTPTRDLAEHDRRPAATSRTRSARTISLQTPEKSYRFNDEVATLLVRPRGWHPARTPFRVDGSRSRLRCLTSACNLLRNTRR